MIFMRVFFILSLLFLISQGKTMVIQKSSDIKQSQRVTEPAEPITIAIVSCPKIIGKYSQSVYNVSLATLLGRRGENFTLRQYDMNDESEAALAETFAKLRDEKVDAVLAPLTGSGAKNLLSVETNLPVFIPTVHKRDIPDAPKNIVFGGIDYAAQIEALLPYMGDSISIFYDSSSVGIQLKSFTEETFLEHKGEKKKFRSYAVDINGDNIITHLSKPSAFNKSSIILHIPVVKSAILASQITFRGIRVRNILSTQINLDPNLLLLTQYRDRKNMIIANSLVEFPTSIYEANELMNNDIAYDWIQYSSSVGIDYLVALLDNTPRAYTMRVINSQIIYPVELLQAKEYGFESVVTK